MDVSTIDFWANNWSSVLHRASPLSKVLSVALILGAIVLTNDFVLLAIIYLSVTAAIAFTRLPTLKILSIGLYPGVFAILFAISRWDGTVLTPAIIILKALSAALAMLMLITTTSYPDIFALFGFVMPKLVVDSLLMAYRSLFLLLDLMGNLLTALRLRGGLRRRRYVRNTRNLANGMGLLLIRSLTLSERLYAVMRVRGYRGRIIARRRHQRLTEHDIAPLSLGLWLAALAIGFRLWSDSLSPFNGYFLLLAVVGLLFATIYSLWPHPLPIKRR